MKTASKVKCACVPCSCQVEVSTGVEKNGQYYCSDACADGHAGGGACSSSGCGCESA
ncbi:MAG: metallothionein [Cyanophyceae cyanobacterium]